MTSETRLVFNQSPKGWRFWREFISPQSPPPGMALMAYTADARNQFVRRWAVWPHPTVIDGVEEMPADVGQKIAPESIKLNCSTTLAQGRTITSRPRRLVSRWEDWHHSRPVIYEASSLWQRIKRALR